jgi:subtilisin-like proprotein convertase family protein
MKATAGFWSHNVWRFSIGAVVLAAGAAAPPAYGLLYTYENTTSGAIPGCGAPLVRTFSVADSFTVSSVAVGFNATHTTRGDIRLVLVAPDNTTLQIITEDDNDNNDHFDILLSPNSEGGINDGDIDPTAEPFFNRMVSVGGLASFFTGNAQGTWSLRICDAIGGSAGTFNRARLVLENSAGASTTGTGTVSYEWGDNGDNGAFVSASVGGITLSQGTTATFGGAAIAPNFVTLTSNRNGHVGHYRMTMDAGTGVDSETIGLETTFDFSQVVRDLTFSLLDVDAAGGSWEDQMRVRAFDGAGNTVPYDRSPSTAHQIGGDLVEGDLSVTDATGNVEYRFDGPVASVTIEYTQGDSPATNASLMLVGISDFVFTVFDYGDAPNTYGSLLSSDGARHVLGDRRLFLGSNPPDGESDGQPAANAASDDGIGIAGVDDEDSVSSFPAFVGGSTTYTVSVTAANQSTTQGAFLVGYIDWNRDGDFADANERSATVAVPASTTTPTAFNVTWSSIPANAGGTTATYARFRISYVQSEVQSPTGLAESGEVEDFLVPVNTLPVTLSSFRADLTRRGLAVEWTTETETSTVGYRVLGWADGTWQPLQPELVPTRATDSLTPESYEVVLPDRGFRILALEDYDLTGKPTRHGPFKVGEQYGRPPQVFPIDWAAIDEENRFRLATFDALVTRPADRGGFPVAELSVSEPGLYRVTYEQLAAAGLDFAGAPLAQLALTRARGGQPVPVHAVAGPATPGLFGPGGHIVFRGEPPAKNLYHRNRVYHLAVGPSLALSTRFLNGRPLGDGLPSYNEVLAIDRDRLYGFSSPTGDPWYEAAVLAQGRSAERVFPLEVDELASPTARLRVDLWGVTDWPGNAPDHHVVIELNGQRLFEQRFDGLVARTFERDLPPGLLAEGTNELKVVLPGDTGYAFDLVHVDRYQVTYPRRFAARDDRLALPGLTGRVSVTGLTSPEVMVAVGSGRFLLKGIDVRPDGQGTYTATFTVPAVTSGDAKVEVSTMGALPSPQIAAARAVPTDLFTGPAQYLVITHPAFRDELDPLVAARSAQGLSVKVVDVFDLYARYTGGEVDPAAIQQYVAAAVGQLKTRFVVLVGGDSYDYLDNLGVGSRSFIPTLYAQTDNIVRFSPADSLLADVDGDGLQDVAIGRFPVRTAAELRLLLDKTLLYPETPARAVFAADGSTDQEFSAISNQLASLLPPTWTGLTAHVDELGVGLARQHLLAAFDQGAALVNFVGHSGPTVWTFQGLFSAADAGALSNVTAPALVVQWGCWNTYHVAPQYDTLAHRLMLSGPQGAAAVVGSSTLTKTSSDVLLGPRLLSRLLAPGATVGESIVAAKRSVAGQGGDLRDVLVGWTLLGDPALVSNP